MTVRWIVLASLVFLAPFASAVLANGSLVRVPHVAAIFVVGWGALVVLGFLGILVWNRADRARLRELALTLRARRLEVCRRCGYDLSATRKDGLCPECGLEFQKSCAPSGPTASPGESPPEPPANPGRG